VKLADINVRRFKLSDQFINQYKDEDEELRELDELDKTYSIVKQHISSYYGYVKDPPPVTPFLGP